MRALKLSAFKFPGEIPAALEAFVSAYHRLFTVVESDSAASIASFAMYSAGTFLAITLPAWMFLYYRKISKPFLRADDLEATANLSSLDNGGIRRGKAPASDDLYEDAFSIDDAGYAEELQFQETLIASEIQFEEALIASELQFEETLIASLFASELDYPSSSMQEPEPMFNTEITKVEIAEGSGQIFCGICLEDKASWLMFANDTCQHSFCYECTASHIEAKIQEKVGEIACPAPGCKAELDSVACRQMISDEALVQWDEVLCMSLIPESETLYCPFQDCSALLLNDLGGVIEKIRCIECKRWFCGQCRVPWHTDFTCKEFKKLYAKKGGKVDKIVKELAKKKRWQKCPKCKMYVEKSEGCMHITCRCGYEFCYRCGATWSDSHGPCRRWKF
ncbi:probable E3 ubiquitin-protein ligase rbrA [Salvia splendens]|uniref:probable E3 ubiquitin-protein ligase rbrA n=1 Tax=Salvia splendens TaxID=180675 RepID=UPI001C25A23F|nr:probable E3 ubiquitin-protein ligase rbrA [Salvia splendens]